MFYDDATTTCDNTTSYSGHSLLCGCGYIIHPTYCIVRERPRALRISSAVKIVTDYKTISMSSYNLLVIENLIPGSSLKLKNCQLLVWCLVLSILERRDNWRKINNAIICDALKEYTLEKLR